MARRLPSAVVAGNGGAENRAALEGFVRAGVPVGLIGYVDERPAVWCAVAPRTEYYAIVHSRTLPMVEAAVEYARSSGARVVEAYPVKTMPGDPGRGVLSTFLDAGFTTYAEERTSAKRNVVVRRSL